MRRVCQAQAFSWDFETGRGLFVKHKTSVRKHGIWKSVRGVANHKVLRTLDFLILRVNETLLVGYHETFWNTQTCKSLLRNSSYNRASHSSMTRLAISQLLF